MKEFAGNREKTKGKSERERKRDIHLFPFPLPWRRVDLLGPDSIKNTGRRKHTF